MQTTTNPVTTKPTLSVASRLVVVLVVATLALGIAGTNAPADAALGSNIFATCESPDQYGNYQIRLDATNDYFQFATYEPILHYWNGSRWVAFWSGGEFAHNTEMYFPANKFWTGWYFAVKIQYRSSAGGSVAQTEWVQDFQRISWSSGSYSLSTSDWYCRM